MSAKLRVCLIQFASQESVAKSVSHLIELVAKAVEKHQPHIIALPEIFATEYNRELPFLESVAEPIADGQICRTLSTLAKKYGIFIVGGSIAERDGSKIYNTSTVWNQNGELVGRHLNVHLFDIHYDNGTDILETNHFSPGNDMTTFDVNGIKCGVAICYDASFEEFIRMYSNAGCEVLFIPAAYHEFVGKKYWELIHRARAFSNQLYVAVISPTRNETHNYVCYGHSMIIDATGEIQVQAGSAEEIVFYEMDMKTVQEARRAPPLLTTGRRPDVYYKCT